ncbi:LytR/AlgR family response regulator transcription factor [Parabacteroides sp. FAFU027]|uniref:LytR/AlgR family response regulator transcription factor n=1 Tax=Parabacteroides sp. FAFU027 TaxID=2922715 RepID=UPI001FAEE178|nr:LytTR family DNA-binding domain-containing protein [Parabacteroides sp. FAFU027]
MPIKCIAIDDEPLALAKVRMFVEKTPGLQLLQTFDNALDAMFFIKQNVVDLIFLDIQMEQLTGIQFLEAINLEAQVIITSAYEEFALKGFDLNVTDYLLKPYSFERFVQAVDKVLGKSRSKVAEPVSTSQECIFIKTEYRLERVDLSDIIYIEGMKDYLQIVTDSRKIMTLQSFKNMEEMLPSSRFQRIHKSFLIAINKIESIEHNRVKINNRLLPISQTYRSSFLKTIENKLPPKYNPE